MVDRAVAEPPPILVAVVGPPKVGKSTLVRCLVKNFARQKVSHVKGPITVVAGKLEVFCSSRLSHSLIPVIFYQRTWHATQHLVF